METIITCLLVAGAVAVSQGDRWPAFRGANTEGIGDGQGVPIEWDAASGRNILWKTPIPGLAHSSPIVWGDRVFVTTASTEKGDDSLRIGLYGDVDSVEDEAEHTWAVYALDKVAGQVLWRRVVRTRKPRARRHLKSTHANPTPVTNGEVLVASFGSEGIYAYDLDGNLLWEKDLGFLDSGFFQDPTYEWGFASSPILHEGRLILQVDVQKGSYIAAYDAETGKQAWRTKLDSELSAGPGVGEGFVVVSTKDGIAIALDAATGDVLAIVGGRR